MAKVELKQPIVEEISNSIKDAQAVVLVNYSGLTVEQDTILRKELREAGSLHTRLHCYRVPSIGSGCKIRWHLHSR